MIGFRRLLVKMTCELSNGRLSIKLTDGTPVVLGRGPETEITDKRCSKKQVELTANIHEQHVTITQLGANNSYKASDSIGRKSSMIFKHSDVLYFLEGQFPFTVYFHHTDFKSSAGKKNKLRQLSDDGNKDWKKRKLDEDSITLNDDGDNENEEEDLEAINEKLQFMKKNFANTDTQECSSNVTDNDSDNVIDNKTSSFVNFRKPNADSKWENPEDSLLVYTSTGVISRNKVAAFDMDGTIITTKSGRVFAVDFNDWKFLLPEIPGKLKKLFADGFKIVFFTNQMGISRGKLKEKDLKTKITEIVRQIPAPIQVFVSTGPGRYRKPALGMWTFLHEKANDGIDIDEKLSFYCGDAAGRPVNWEPKRKKDFSCSDRLFAINAGLAFHTPEEFFKNSKKAPFNLPEFNPRNLDSNGPLTDPANEEITSTTQELIVNVGFPASGKSFFSEMYLIPEGYVYISRDILGSWQACVSKCLKALDSGLSVVIDNTNPDPESRKSSEKLQTKITRR
ncbi:bifunctional polynucleotide phosphatase/kinase-like isoform X2 [Tubulanus polymorphus]|uniref:bifunctional polynucleotide phosphatase/kinase-like isoform X2 n=1 Tax=Tubulanus polymorphus TaxID=672921 RepID=UPI003DA39D20